MPAPPVTTNAPEFVEVLEEVLDITNVLVVPVVPEPIILPVISTISPVTYKLPPIPTPPLTTNAPELVLVA